MSQELLLGFLVIVLLVLVVSLILPIGFRISSKQVVRSKIIAAMGSQPSRWMNWKDIKILSRQSSEEILECLLLLTHTEVLECRFRDPAIVARLKHPRARTYKPSAPVPIVSYSALFYEFRIKVEDDVGRRRPRKSGNKQLVPQTA